MTSISNEVDAARPVILISANSLFNIVNFRTGLIRALAVAGYRPIVVAPADGATLPPGFPAEHVPIDIARSGLNPAVDALLAYRYFWLLHRLRPAAYLSFTIKPNIYGAIAASAAGVPSLPNVSGLGTAFLGSGKFASFVSSLYRFAFRRSAIVFFQNPDDRDLFLARKIVRADQVRLLPGSGIDLDRFHPAEGAQPAHPTFLFIGRLIADKGVREFVEAARRVKALHPDARFQLLGALDPGNRTAVAEAELKGWIEEGIVEHLGQVDDVRPAIAGSSAVVLPSYREGLPRSLLEGAAMGKPLIATDVPGNNELVEDGVTGLRCRVRDAASLSAAIERFIAMDQRDRQSLGDAALNLVRTRFSEQQVIGAYLEALQPLRGKVGWH